MRELRRSSSPTSAIPGEGVRATRLPEAAAAASAATSASGGGVGAFLLVALCLIVGAFGTWTLLDRLAPTDRQTGLASWYGPGFYGRPTASGATYTGADLTAAHRALPLGTRVRVTNLENGRRVVVVVDDRGPYVGGRVIDLSTAAARRLDMIRDGVVRVRVEVLGRPERARA